MSALSTAPTRTPSVERQGKPSWRFSYHAEILLASFSALLIEISYTRIISYKLFYYYVYLVIGLALLGTGTGGVLVAVSKRLQRMKTDAILFWALLLGSAVTIAAYSIIAHISLDTLSVWRYGTWASTKSFLLLLLLCLCVFVSFISSGVIASVLFGRRPGAVGGLYFADLLGAGIACAAVIYLISSVGAPATVMIAAATMAAGAAWMGLRLKFSLSVLAGVVAAAAVVLVAVPSILPTQSLDASKISNRIGNQTAPGSDNWGPIFRVDVSKVQGNPDILNLYHDGILGSGILAWNGTHSFLNRYNFPQDPRAIPFNVLGQPPANEAILGAAGGHEVLTSMYYNAKHVDAVEVNPVTVDLVRHTYANFDGHLAQNPHVNYVTGDGRSFMARTNKHYNLIWYPAPDSYAATNSALSAAYVLTESYLYTTNGVQTNLEHLTNNGIFVAQFGEVDDQYDLRTSRFVATARQALANLGIKDPTNHIMVATTTTNFFGAIPMSTILVSRSPLTSQQISGFTSSLHSVPATTPMYSPVAPSPKNPVQTLMQTPNSKLNAFYSSYPYDISPTTDQDPYFYHFARYGTVLSHFFHSSNSLDRENSIGERVLILLLGLSIVISAVFLLLPFATVRKQWRRMPRKSLSAIFFAGVGLGFIFFEITLMQLFNLFLGYPTYAITVVLVSLLIFSGIGALLSMRVRQRARAVPLLLVALLALGLYYIFGLTPTTNALLSIALPARMVISIALIAPLGLCLGMFMPIGLGVIAGLGGEPRQYVAWGWAVNGFASVVGSALATILSMIWNFNTVLWLAMAAYVIATAAFVAITSNRRLPGRAAADTAVDTAAVGTS
jgi:hypothetical protein